jgi:6-phosphogluconolactonase
MKNALLLLAAALPVLAAPLPIAIGTNTGGSGKSEGIYLSTFDPDKGSFGEVTLGAKYAAPGFLTLHPTKPLLYAVGRSAAHPKGSIAVFKLGGTLEFLAEAGSGGENPCHLAVDDSGKVLAVANYGDGSTATLRLDDKGLPAGPGFSKRADGKGARADRQDGPHAHGVYFRGKLIHMPDLGVDKVLAYRIDPASAQLAETSPAAWPTAPGAGPRHMAFSPDGKHAYVVNELDNTVTAGVYDAKAGTFETLHSVPTLPADWQGNSSTAEIQVHPNGKFVYASNRGHDSIAVFARDAATGRLAPVEVAPCGGKVPRHFTLSPDGKWLLCAHQDSNTLAALPLDPASGKLGAPKATTAAPNPICILFLR